MISYIFLAVGIFFILLSVFGMVKMKDFLLRLQVASKASTLGVIFCLIAVFAQNPTPEVFTKAILTILFLFLTVPVSAQAIAKVAHTFDRKHFCLEYDDLDKDESKNTC